MARVELLDDALVDQIAAGEVVERPASVVKELVENALDAGATAIVVAIAEGGRDRIRVVDDGEGMSREDATMAIRRHATSKLRHFEDLLALGTLGFRGEALPSIASVSRFELTTRRREDVVGTRVVIEGGAPEVRDAGCAPGTTVDVRELFFNVPARRKFLRARHTERQHVADVVLRAALAHPRVRFVLEHDGRLLRELLPAPSRYARAKATFDEPLRPLAGELAGLRIEGGLGDPANAKRGMKQLYLFVNGRPVVDIALARAIAFAHGDALPKGRYPTGAVFLELDPREVDVNAHPQKTEVRFAEVRKVTDALTRILTEGLGTRRWTDDEGHTVRGSAAKASTRAPSAGPLERGGAFWKGRLRPGPSAPSRTEPAPLAPSPRPPRSDAEELFASALRERPAAPGEPDRPVAQDAPVGTAPVGTAPGIGTARGIGTAPGIDPATGALGRLSNGLVVGELEGALHVIAPAAVWTAMARAVLAQREIPRRRLLFPTRLEVDDAEAIAGALAGLGFDLRPIGERTVAVHAIPRLDPDMGVPGDVLARAALGAPSHPPNAAAQAVAEAFAEAAMAEGAVDASDPASVWRAYCAMAPEDRRSVTRLPLDELER